MPLGFIVPAAVLCAAVPADVADESTAWPPEPQRLVVGRASSPRVPAVAVQCIQCTYCTDACGFLPWCPPCVRSCVCRGLRRAADVAGSGGCGRQPFSDQSSWDPPFFGVFSKQHFPLLPRPLEYIRIVIAGRLLDPFHVPSAGCRRRRAPVIRPPRPPPPRAASGPTAHRRDLEPLPVLCPATARPTPPPPLRRHQDSLSLHHPPPLTPSLVSLCRPPLLPPRQNRRASPYGRVCARRRPPDPPPSARAGRHLFRPCRRRRAAAATPTQPVRRPPPRWP